MHIPGAPAQVKRSTDRLRAHGAPRRRGRDRPPLRSGDDRALGGVHGRGRRASGAEGGHRWLADTPAGPSKGNGRPCARAAPASGTRPSPARPPPRRVRLGGLRRRREGTIGGAYALAGFRTGADLQRVLALALTDTLELENSVPRTRVLARLVAAAARVKETTRVGGAPAGAGGRRLAEDARCGIVSAACTGSRPA